MLEKLIGKLYWTGMKNASKLMSNTSLNDIDLSFDPETKQGLIEYLAQPNAKMIPLSQFYENYPVDNVTTLLDNIGDDLCQSRRRIIQISEESLQRLNQLPEKNSAIIKTIATLKSSIKKLQKTEEDYLKKQELSTIQVPAILDDILKEKITKLNTEAYSWYIDQMNNPKPESTIGYKIAEIYMETKKLLIYTLSGGRLTCQITPAEEIYWERARTTYQTFRKVSKSWHYFFARDIVDNYSAFMNDPEIQKQINMQKDKAALPDLKNA